MSESQALLSGVPGLTVLGAYLAVLLALGWWARVRRTEDSLGDFYLANRNIGVISLFLTLYATQYSGNNLIGFPGNVYRNGFLFLSSVTFMMGIVGSYLLIAPRLYRLSRSQAYITSGDLIQDRFGSPLLTGLLNLVFLFALGAYILTNLKAIGHIVEVASGGRIPFTWGVIGLSLIMVLYETLGGLRAVVWTDLLQGVILLFGCVAIFLAIQIYYGGLSAAAETLTTQRPDFWLPPTREQKLGWFSSLLLVSFGAAIYPHAIQRIYAARSDQTLRTAFKLMLIMPVVTTFFMFVLGIVGAAHLPGLDQPASERITILMLEDLAHRQPLLTPLLILFVTAAIAAIMSTVDSALLSISSLFSRDLLARVRPQSSQRLLTLSGKLLSWVLIALLCGLAIELPQTIWRLTLMKMEILVQAAPVMVLALGKSRPNPLLLTVAVLCGLLVTIGLRYTLFGLPEKPFGIHPGTWGLLVNLGITSLWFLPRRRPELPSQ